MDAKREALAKARYSVLDESGVLRREVSALDLATAALGYDSLLHRQMVIFGRREEFAVQLPAVDHLKKPTGKGNASESRINVYTP